MVHAKMTMIVSSNWFDFQKVRNFFSIRFKEHGQTIINAYIIDYFSQMFVFSEFIEHAFSSAKHIYHAKGYVLSKHKHNEFALLPFCRKHQPHWPLQRCPESIVGTV